MKRKLLRASNLWKIFNKPLPTHILNGVSLELYEGESIAITGRSGEGKTTLLHILGTLEPYDEGELFIAEKSASCTSVCELRNQHIGFVFQSFHLLEDFTALENVLMPARIGRRSADRRRGMELLERVGLGARARYPAKLLSGGERQRIAIARALCNDPDILLADEPSGNLDRENAEAIAALLFNLVEERKMALLLVTHDLSLATRCQKHYTLSQGKLFLERDSLG